MLVTSISNYWPSTKLGQGARRWPMSSPSRWEGKKREREREAQKGKRIKCCPWSTNFQSRKSRDQRGWAEWMWRGTEVEKRLEGAETQKGPGAAEGRDDYRGCVNYGALGMLGLGLDTGGCGLSVGWERWCKSFQETCLNMVPYCREGRQTRKGNRGNRKGKANQNNFQRKGSSWGSWRDQPREEHMEEETMSLLPQETEWWLGKVSNG